MTIKIPMKTIGLRSKVVSKPLRKAVTYSELLLLLNSECKSRHSALLHSRMIVSSVVMFLLGIRVSEAHTLTKTNLDHLISNQCTVLFRSKSNDYHKYYTTAPGVKLLKNSTFNKHLQVVLSHNETVGGATLLKTYTKNFNRYLKLYLHYDKTSPITSHSFRISRITSLISSGVSLSNVALLIGHKQVTTTFRYYRFTATPDVLKQILSADTNRLRII
jgi:site-specific recombinase XerD